MLDQLTISNLHFSNISLSICHWWYNYLLLGFRILVGHISHQSLRKFLLITRIILQKHKYDIQIFPKYSWMTVLFEKILIVKDIMKYFLSKWFSLKRAFGRYFYLLRTLTFVIPYWTYWSLVILSTGHMRTRSYENTPFWFGHGTLVPQGDGEGECSDYNFNLNLKFKDITQFRNNWTDVFVCGCIFNKHR